MPFSKAYYETYLNLPEELPGIHKDLRLDNHCYLRIALDNTFNTKWDTVLKRPAYKNLKEKELKQVIALLTTYKTNRKLLQKHNQNSLNWRKQI